MRYLICLLLLLPLISCEDSEDKGAELLIAAMQVIPEPVEIPPVVEEVPVVEDIPAEEEGESIQDYIDRLFPVVVDATGTKVGNLTNRGVVNENGFALTFLQPYLGYSQDLVYYEPSENPYYITSDCSGTAYHTLKRGEILKTASADYYYVSKAADKILITFNSQSSGLACNSSSDTGYFYELIPNDPAVTGFDPSIYNPPYNYSPG